MPSSIFPSENHDHDQCIERAVSEAVSLCHQRGARLTDQRREVLELVWASHRPVGAYEILDGLKALGRNAAPPTVYRALEFLLIQGLVHRVEHLNAYVGCVHPGKPHEAQFLLCTACGRLAELNDQAIAMVIDRRAEKRRFQVARVTVEIEGLCLDCQSPSEGLE